MYVPPCGRCLSSKPSPKTNSSLPLRLARPVPWPCCLPSAGPPRGFTTRIPNPSLPARMEMLPLCPSSEIPPCLNTLPTSVISVVAGTEADPMSPESSQRKPSERPDIPCSTAINCLAAPISSDRRTVLGALGSHEAMKWFISEYSSCTPWRICGRARASWPSRDWKALASMCGETWWARTVYS